MNKNTPLLTMLVAVCLSSHGNAASIANSSFENGWESWIDLDKDGKSTSLSSEARTGEKSAKITSSAGSIAQMIDVKPNTNYELTAYVEGGGIIGVKLGDAILFERQKKTKDWTLVTLTFNSSDQQRAGIFAQFNGGKNARFDDFNIREIDDNIAVEAEAIRVNDNGLSPDLPPGQNFELIDWSLTLPVDEDGDGKADEVFERDLVKGYTHKSFFYTADDGGMVFRAPVQGTTTSSSTKYVRTELREMLRRGDESIGRRGEDGRTNKNNWVFSTAPAKTQRASGGVDGDLVVTMAVNHVTTTGVKYQQGRVIIGQIHAKSDEPVRLYYRKLPNHKKGSLYIAHEPIDGDDQWYELLGDRGDSAEDPEDGIALNEQFTYEINVRGNLLIVTISQGDEDLASVDLDMSNSGYDNADDYMYFKAGVYNQNSTGDADDYAQATIYDIQNIHY